MVVEGTVVHGKMINRWTRSPGVCHLVVFKKMSLGVLIVHALTHPIGLGSNTQHQTMNQSANIYPFQAFKSNL